jgi:hypothetical protein
MLQYKISVARPGESKALYSTHIPLVRLTILVQGWILTTNIGPAEILTGEK